jgi:hypothetical protein
MDFQVPNFVQMRWAVSEIEQAYLYVKVNFHSFMKHRPMNMYGAVGVQPKAFVNISNERITCIHSTGSRKTPETSQTSLLKETSLELDRVTLINRFVLILIISIHSFRSSPPDVGLTQSPIQCVQGALSLRVNRPRSEADHSPPTSAEVKNTSIYTSTPPYVFME